MGNDNKWYDSVWLTKYLDAKELIARSYPSRLEEFVARFDVLRTRPDFTIKEFPGLLDSDALDLVKRTIDEIPMSMIDLSEVRQFGRFVVRDNPVFKKMQSDMADMISEQTGEAVEPHYNFLSLYSKMGVCEPHIDSPGSKWTLDICIDQSTPWPIHFSQIIPWPEDMRNLDHDWQQAIKSDRRLKFEAKILEPGSGILFAGSSQWHYRDALPQTSQRGFCNLLFFHYIPKGTKELIIPKNWAHIFGIPELADIPGIHAAI